MRRARNRSLRKTKAKRPATQKRRHSSDTTDSDAADGTPTAAAKATHSARARKQAAAQTAKKEKELKKQASVIISRVGPVLVHLQGLATNKMSSYMSLLPVFMVNASHEHMSKVTGIETCWKKVANDLEAPEKPEHAFEAALATIDKASNFANDLETMLKISSGHSE